VKVPTSDSGIATVGITTDRIEPRKANTTSVTMTSACGERPDDLVDCAVHGIS